jgi:hypothetical protein
LGAADLAVLVAFFAVLRGITLRAAEAALLVSDFLVLRAMNWGLPQTWSVVAGATVSTGG